MKVGKVTHYYDNIGVVIVKLETTLKFGDKIKFQGHNSDFEQDVQSLQIDHMRVDEAHAGDVIGLKVDQKVKEGTEVEKV